MHQQPLPLHHPQPIHCFYFLSLQWHWLHPDSVTSGCFGKLFSHWWRAAAGPQSPGNPGQVWQHVNLQCHYKGYSLRKINLSGENQSIDNLGHIKVVSAAILPSRHPFWCYVAINIQHFLNFDLQQQLTNITSPLHYQYFLLHAAVFWLDQAMSHADVALHSKIAIIHDMSFRSLGSQQSLLPSASW